LDFSPVAGRGSGGKTVGVVASSVAETTMARCGSGSSSRDKGRNGNATSLVACAVAPIAAGNPKPFTSLLLRLKRVLYSRGEIIGKIRAWR